MRTEYHKIPTVWDRDPATKFKTLIEGEFATRELYWLRDNEWVWTEKVDGTNIRVIWDGAAVTFLGRTDNAQMHPRLMAWLTENLTSEKMTACFDGPATLYGEGFGGKIQRGGRYGTSEAFVLFDVSCGGMWLCRDNVVDIGNKLGIQAVPIVGRGTLNEMVTFVRSGLVSRWGGEYEAEGIVARPECELLDRRGQRIITKIKAKDFR